MFLPTLLRQNLLFLFCGEMIGVYGCILVGLGLQVRAVILQLRVVILQLRAVFLQVRAKFWQLSSYHICAFNLSGDQKSLSYLEPSAVQRSFQMLKKSILLSC